MTVSFIQLATGSTHSFLDGGPVGVLSGKSTVLGTETIIPLVTQDRFKNKFETSILCYISGIYVFHRIDG